MFCRLLSSSSFNTHFNLFQQLFYSFVLFVKSKIKKKKDGNESFLERVISSRISYGNFVPSILTLTQNILSRPLSTRSLLPLGAIPDVKRWRWIEIHNFHFSHFSIYEVPFAPLPEIKNTGWMRHSQVQTARECFTHACIQSTFWILFWCKLIAGEISCNT